MSHVVVRSALLLLLAASAVAQTSRETRLAAVISEARKAKAKIGAFAIRPGDPKALYAYEPDLALTPASNQKVLTCVAAVLLHGMDAEIRTEFFAHGVTETGVLKGSLRVRGEGDPTCGHQDFGDSMEALRAVAARLKERGLVRIAGDLLIDDSAFDAARIGPDWPNDAPTDRWMAPTAALSFDEALARVLVRPGRGPGEAAEAAPSPDVGYVRIANRLKTVERKQDAALAFERGAEGVLTAKGAVRLGARPVLHDVAVDDPALFFGHALRRALSDAGIVLDGSVRRTTEEERQGGEILLTVRTPFSRIFPRLLKNSQNHRADMLFRHLGYRATGLGSFAAGSAAVRKALESAGVPTEGVEIADGSGLSRRNRTTARALAGALAAVAARSESATFRAMLAEPGEGGTLERRLPQLKERVFAKTGTLDGASSLSGFLRLADGEWIIFAVILNGAAGQPLRAHADAFATALAGP